MRARLILVRLQNPSFVWSEEYQTELMSEHFKAFDVLRSKQFFVGEMIWNFADFRTEQSERLRLTPSGRFGWLASVLKSPRRGHGVSWPTARPERTSFWGGDFQGILNISPCNSSRRQMWSDPYNRVKLNSTRRTVSYKTFRFPSIFNGVRHHVGIRLFRRELGLGSVTLVHWFLSRKTAFKSRVAFYRLRSSPSFVASTDLTVLDFEFIRFISIIESRFSVCKTLLNSAYDQRVRGRTTQIDNTKFKCVHYR